MVYVLQEVLMRGPEERQEVMEMEGRDETMMRGRRSGRGVDCVGCSSLCELGL